ncbi:hypothetical protein V9K67_23955 [Paraflavisolibacter sp. H34]|uniref:hypothetical protein n=1 Tax=Huijunlia imazamoxiresistens TaxID=3127457 RepID=UPI00301A12C7
MDNSFSQKETNAHTSGSSGHSTPPAAATGRNREVVTKRTVPSEEPDCGQPCVFSLGDWSCHPPSLPGLGYLREERKITPETLRLFLPFIRTVSYTRWWSGNQSLAFPFTLPGSEAEIVGLELEHYQFRGNAPGTDRQEGCWCARFSCPSNISDIFLFEAAVDALSFFELYHQKLLVENCAFVSLGGSPAQGQLLRLAAAFPGARFTTGFTNDFQGNLYDIEVACILMNKEYSVLKNDGHLTITLDGREYPLDPATCSLAAFRRKTGLRPILKALKPVQARSFNQMHVNRKTARYEPKTGYTDH